MGFTAQRTALKSTTAHGETLPHLTTARAGPTNYVETFPDVAHSQAYYEQNRYYVPSLVQGTTIVTGTIWVKDGSLPTHLHWA